MLKASLLFFISLGLWAQSNSFQGLTFDVPSFHYLHDRGVGELSHLRIDFNQRQKKISEYRELLVLKQDKQYSLMIDFFNLVWHNPPAWVLLIEELLVRNLDASLGLKETSVDTLNLEYLEVKGAAPLNGSMKDLKASCIPVDKEGEGSFDQRMLQACIHRGVFEIKEFNAEFINELFYPILAQLPPLPAPQDQELNELVIKTLKGQLDVSLKLKVLIPTRIKLKGEISDTAESVIVKVDSVRMGIFGVTTLFFRYLRDQVQDPRIKIEPPRIIFLKHATH
jgi:hypothetical protein